MFDPQKLQDTTILYQNIPKYANYIDVGLSKKNSLFN